MIQLQVGCSYRAIRRRFSLGLIFLLICSIALADDSQPGKKSAPNPDSDRYQGTKAGDERSDNSIGLKLCWCPQGTFRMGNDATKRGSDEHPVDVILTQGFWIGKFEVTQQQWQKTLGTSPWRNRDGVKEGADIPATWVSWDDANLFCEALTKRDQAAGKLPKDWEYRLPSEAQWEYASRAGSKTRYHFGDKDSGIETYAWCSPETKNSGAAFAHPVGQKKPNAWGLYDVQGNALEWCRDWYASSLPGGSDPQVTDDSSKRLVARGGDWRHDSNVASLTHREQLARSERNSALGLRVAVVRIDSREKSEPQPEVGVAIVPFENSGTSVENNRLGQALGEMLADDLAQIQSLRVLERSSVDALVQERTLAETGASEQSGTAARSKRVADYLLTGKFRADAGKLTMSVRMTRIGLDDQPKEWSVAGRYDDLISLERDLSLKVIAGLGADPRRRRQPPPITDHAAPTLAILPFVNHSRNAELDDVGKSLADIVQANLSAISRIPLIDRDTLNSVLAEQQLSASGLVDPNTAIQLGKLVQAERFLVGSFLELKDSVSIQTRLIDSGTGNLVSSQRVVGARTDLGNLIDDLVLKVVADLAVRPADKALEILQKRTPARTLEGAVYLATMQRLYRVGKFAEAAETCQRAILIEPANFSFYRERIYYLRSAQKFDDLFRTVEAALARPEFSSASEYDRKEIVRGDVYPLFTLGRFAEVIQSCERFKKAFPAAGDRDFANGWIRGSLASMNRANEIEAFWKKCVDEESDGQNDWQNKALQRLFEFYRNDAHFGFRNEIYSKNSKYDPETSKALIRKALEIYERILKSAAGKQDDAAKEWGKLFVPEITSLTFVDKTGNFVPYLSPDQQVDYLKRSIDTFGWDPVIANLGRFRMAMILEQSGKSEQALKAYQECARDQQGVIYSNMPASSDLSYEDPTTWIDRKIEAYYRVAKILKDSLRRPEDAKAAYRTMVREVGLAHFAGADAIVDMHQLGITPEFPEKCVLIWGGDTSGVLSWQKLLEPHGFKVHTLRELRVNPPQLTPYSFVVLNRAGYIPYSPREILALRSFVASGGSLLVVVSPAWEAAPPGIHNPLLSFFGMECETEQVLEAASTKIKPHPITEGIAETTARNAIHIRAPADASLIESHDKVVLAAVPYRFGRVVVASFGQWYLPDTSILPENWQNLAPGGRKENIHLSPIEFGTRLQTPLLMNVVRWLTESRPRDTQYEPWRQSWREAQMTAWKAQAHVEPASQRLIPWAEMKPILERVVSEAFDDTSREESLWLAGEAFQQMGFYHYGPTGAEPRPHLSWTAYGYDPLKDTPLLPEPEYYQRLIQQFPESPLRPYAQWRLAECARRSKYVKLSLQIYSHVIPPTKLIARYEQVEAPEGSYARAWNNLRMGAIYLTTQNYAKAIPCFRDVIESMPNGPEKAIAMQNIAICQEQLNEFSEARRSYQAVLEMPQLHYRNTADWFMLWCPLTVQVIPIHYTGKKLPDQPDFQIRAFAATGTSWDLAREGLKRLQAKK